MPDPSHAPENVGVGRAMYGGRRYDIQGLRAIAVLLVVAFHSGLPVQGGFVGVDMFFVISGFVITNMLGREWERTRQVDFKQFYLRRFKRLTPALALLTAATVLISALIASPLGPQQTGGKTAIGAMLLVANFAIARTTGGYFDAAAETNPLLHTWSLSVEEQFYIIFPALMVLGWTLARKRSLPLVPHFVVASVALVSFTLAVAGSRGYGNNLFPGARVLLGFYSPFTRAWEFAVGALLALALSRRRVEVANCSTLLGVAGLILVASSALVINETTPFPGAWTLLPVSGTLLLLVSGVNPASAPSRLLSSGPMVRLGDWSYSIYLWHWPLIVFAGLLWPTNATMVFVAASVSFVPAIMSYEWVEQPIRSLSSLTSRRWTQLMAATVVPPVLFGIALWCSAAHGWWLDPVRRFQAATLTFHVGSEHGCDRSQPLSDSTPSRCIWNRNDKGKPIYLLGDSNADHFSDGVVQTGHDLGRPVWIATTNACPFVDLQVRSTKPGSDNPGCRSYVKGTLEFLKHAEAGLILISNFDGYWSTDKMIEAGTSTADLSAEPSQKLEAFATGLSRTVNELRTAGHQVLVFQTIPHARNWAPTKCSVLTILRGGCIVTRTLQEALEDQLAVRAVIAAVTHASKVSVWDPARSLCPDDYCSTEAPSFVRYRDVAHISVPQAVALGPTIRDLIKSTGN
jgi:peptidoglycan/LPS O-acetylase OafA/YrhL